VKVLSFNQHGETRLGIFVDLNILDIQKAYSICSENISPEIVEGIKTEGVFKDALSFIQSGEEGLKLANAIIEELHKKKIQFESALLDFNSAHLEAPIKNPNKIICIGLNYADHCKEQGIAPPQNPVIFSKFSTAIIGPGEDIIHPRITKQLDYEGELAVIIGKMGKYIDRDNAVNFIFGYTILNDVTARDIQFSDGQWIRAKSFDTFAPIGPWIVTKDEIPNPNNLNIRTYVNGQISQNSNTKNMIFDIPYLLEFISSVFTLYPGDIISTGTPPGVGIYRDPPYFLHHSDEITIEIEKIGELKNTVVEESMFA